MVANMLHDYVPKTPFNWNSKAVNRRWQKAVLYTTLQLNMIIKCILSEPAKAFPDGAPLIRALLSPSLTHTIPEDGPLGLQPGDGGVLHVLEAQVPLEVGLVHAHGHRHVPDTVGGDVRLAGDPHPRPPVGEEPELDYFTMFLLYIWSQ